jgi:hypothetical protein
MSDRPPFFDELGESTGAPRAPYRDYCSWFSTEEIAHLRRKASEAEGFFRRTGITFNVYGADEADERLIPFDIVPRIISAREWARLTKGIEQRVRAINAFLYDIYHRQEILRAGRVPTEPDRQERRLPAPDDRRRAAGQCLYPYRRRRPGAHRAKTSSTCSKTTPAPPPACPTCWKTAKRCCRCFPNSSPQNPRPAGAGLSHTPRPLALRLRPAGAARAPDHRRPDPGHPQFRVFRAFLPGRPCRREAGRGARPARGRRPHRHAHDARLQARSTCSTAASTTTISIR